MSKKGQKTAKNIKALKDKAIKNRLDKMIYYRQQVVTAVKELGYEYVLINGVDLEDGIHINPVHLMKGNEKTGQQCWTISFIPIFDCVNCSGCYNLCYDIRNDCIYPSVLQARAINSALRELDPVRFWQRVGELVAENFVTELRINVGGDLRDEDFELVHYYIAMANPKCDVLFFTKNYKGINKWLDTNGNTYASNLHPLMSGWKGMKCDNKYNLPMSHVLFADGSTDNYCPTFGAHYCGGNCTECNFKSEGCWILKANEHVIFLAH